MDNRLRKVLFSFSLLFFFISLAVHILSLMGINLQASMPFLWGLHLVVFLCLVPGFIPFFEYFQSLPKPEKGRRKLTISSLWRYFNNVPWPFIFLCVALLFYAAYNFSQFSIASEGGGPSINDGNYVLQNHGTILREITKEEYNLFQANELRGFSGHWMAFFWFSAMLSWPKKNL